MYKTHIDNGDLKGIQHFFSDKGEETRLFRNNVLRYSVDAKEYNIAKWLIQDNEEFFLQNKTNPILYELFIKAYINEDTEQKKQILNLSKGLFLRGNLNTSIQFVKRIDMFNKKNTTTNQDPSYKEDTDIIKNLILLGIQNDQWSIAFSEFFFQKQGSNRDFYENLILEHFETYFAYIHIINNNLSSLQQKEDVYLFKNGRRYRNHFYNDIEITYKKMITNIKQNFAIYIVPKKALTMSLENHLIALRDMMIDRFVSFRTMPRVLQYLKKKMLDIFMIKRYNLGFRLVLEFNSKNKELDSYVKDQLYDIAIQHGFTTIMKVIENHFNMTFDPIKKSPLDIKTETINGKSVEELIGLVLVLIRRSRIKYIKDPVDKELHNVMKHYSLMGSPNYFKTAILAMKELIHSTYPVPIYFINRLMIAASKNIGIVNLDVLFISNDYYDQLLAIFKTKQYKQHPQKFDTIVWKLTFHWIIYLMKSPKSNMVYNIAQVYGFDTSQTWDEFSQQTWSYLQIQLKTWFDELKLRQQDSMKPFIKRLQDMLIGNFVHFSSVKKSLQYILEKEEGPATDIALTEWYEKLVNNYKHSLFDQKYENPNMRDLKIALENDRIKNNLGMTYYGKGIRNTISNIVQDSYTDVKNKEEQSLKRQLFRNFVIYFLNGNQERFLFYTTSMIKYKMENMMFKFLFEYVYVMEGANRMIQYLMILRSKVITFYGNKHSNLFMIQASLIMFLLKHNELFSNQFLKTQKNHYVISNIQLNASYFIGKDIHVNNWFTYLKEDPPTKGYSIGYNIIYGDTTKATIGKDNFYENRILWMERKKEEEENQ